MPYVFIKKKSDRLPPSRTSLHTYLKPKLFGPDQLCASGHLPRGTICRQSTLVAAFTQQSIIRHSGKAQHTTMISLI